MDDAAQATLAELKPRPRSQYVQQLRFEPAHLDLINLREGQELVVAHRDHAKLQGELGPSVTLVIDNKIVGCGGVASSLPGIGECWMVCGAEFAQYRYTVYNYVCAWLGLMDFSFHRLEMSVRADFPAGMRFAEKFGFRQEGIKHKADPLGRDYILYAKVR